MQRKFDLHLHTTASDGMAEPQDAVRIAAGAGLSCIAVTDHDTAAGVLRAQAAGRRIGLPVIAGVEFSAAWQTEMHILGYGMDIMSPAYQAFVEEQKARRRQRNEQMLRRLAELGYSMPEEYTPEAIAGEYGRKHMALGLVKAGHATSVNKAFEDFLATGRPAHVRRRKFTPADLIGAIGASGGQAVLAHPGRMGVGGEELSAIAADLRGHGLAGIEAFYPEHTPEEADVYGRLCRDTGLIPTYGSDWHGLGGEGIARGFDSFHVPDVTYDWLQGLMRAGGFL